MGVRLEVGSRISVYRSISTPGLVAFKVAESGFLYAGIGSFGIGIKPWYN
ncbi:hypothetical protein Q0V21_14115 [Paenibacillus sp. 11B]|nr:hypothetical protein [Paenibacillus sp. 11B]